MFKKIFLFFFYTIMTCNLFSYPYHYAVPTQDAQSDEIFSQSLEETLEQIVAQILSEPESNEKNLKIADFALFLFEHKTLDPRVKLRLLYHIERNIVREMLEFYSQKRCPEGCTDDRVQMEFFGDFLFSREKTLPFVRQFIELVNNSMAIAAKKPDYTKFHVTAAGAISGLAGIIIGLVAGFTIHHFICNGHDGGKQIFTITEESLRKILNEKDSQLTNDEKEKNNNENE